MRSNHRTNPKNRVDNLVEAVRVQIEDFDDDQLERLINLLIFEQRDREKDLEELRILDVTSSQDDPEDE